MNSQEDKELRDTERINALEKYKTASKKMLFIKELKGGLGKELKENPAGFKIIKKPLYQKVGAFIKKIFTKF